MIAGLFVLAYAAALRVGALIRRGFRKPPSRDQVARNFRKIAKRANPGALADFRRARSKMAKGDPT